MNRRLPAFVLLLFVASLAFAGSADAFGVHHAETAGCHGDESHYCGDQDSHDADHCTICEVGGLSFGLAGGELPFEAARSLDAVAIDPSTFLPAFEFTPFAPRGPPVPPS